MSFRETKMIRYLLAVCLSLVAISVSAQSTRIKSETVETIPSRGEHTQTFIFISVDGLAPRCCCFRETRAHSESSPNGSAQFDMFFVFRARKLLAEQGFNVMALDAPRNGGREVFGKSSAALSSRRTMRQPLPMRASRPTFRSYSWAVRLAPSPQQGLRPSSRTTARMR